MKLIETKLTIGAEKPFHFLHMSDTHFTLADGRDDARKQALAADRTKWHSDAETISAEAEAFARKQELMIAHTGDYIDFVSEANLDRLKQFTDENDAFFAAGNHEFSLYVGEAFEDAAYREQSLARVQACIKNDMRFAARQVCGVNLIAIDNGYYLFEEWQLEALKREAARGLPMLLFMHTPLYDPELYHLMGAHGCLGEAAYMVATPKELMTAYSDYRRRQQTADAVTLEMVEYIKQQLLIRGIFCGHLHDFVSETRLTDRITQYVSNFGNVRLVEVR